MGIKGFLNTIYNKISSYNKPDEKIDASLYRFILFTKVCSQIDRMDIVETFNIKNPGQFEDYINNFYITICSMDMILGILLHFNKITVDEYVGNIDKIRIIDNVIRSLLKHKKIHFEGKRYNTADIWEIHGQGKLVINNAVITSISKFTTK